MTTVYIDQDPLTLGSAATQDDLDTYCSNLESHLDERFPGRDIRVETTLGGERAGHVCPEDEELEQYVRELHGGDGWISLLGAVD